MESEIPVVSTTSSTDLLNDKKNKNQPNENERRAENVDSIAQNSEDSTKNEIKETNINDSEHLIEGLAKPSSALEKVDFHRDSHNRVKLYVLCDQRNWNDKGTGHVACLPSPENNNNWCIIVRLESNELNVLESLINLDTVYQKQQGTLIVWSETDTIDLALSFQEKTGCSELWEKICRIQGRDPEIETEVEEEAETDEQENAQNESSFSTLCNSITSGAIPACNLQNLAEIEQLLSNSMVAPSQREKMANGIIQNGYISKLCELFTMCEDLENKEALQQLASIGKNLFLLNNNSVLNELIDEKHFQNIVGMLEYDASYVEPKRHREFLWERSKFKEVLPISSNELKEKIHQTFRLQYVQDVCLPAPSIFEENLLTVLTSHLYFIRAEIVNALLNDKELMQLLFEQLKKLDILPGRQRDLTKFLKEFCSFAHSLQPSGPQGREQFFKTLMDNDVLNTIDPCISSTLATTRAATVELLTIIVDFNPQIFREFLLKQSRRISESKNSTLLINKLIIHMLSDADSEFTSGYSMSNILKILLDPESSIIAKREKDEFLQMFYKRAMQTLCAPIIENTKDGNPFPDTYYMANKIALIVDLLCFFVEHHNYPMRIYTIQNGLLQSVLVFLKSKHHFLTHCALRLLRRTIGLKDDSYIRHIHDKGILDLVVDCFVANGTHYNLLNSSMVELFEYIRTEEIRPLIQYTIQKHWDKVFSKVHYVRTFSQMKVRCQQYADTNGGENGTFGQQNDSKESILSGMSPLNTQWRKEREHDDEELFFSKDDEEMPAPQLRKSGIEPMFHSLANRKRKANDDEDSIATVFGGNITPPAGSTNRISKIMIRMGNNNKQQQQMAEPSRPQSQPAGTWQFQNQNENESKPPNTANSFIKKKTPPPPTISSEITITMPTSTSTPNSPSTLKRPLVDYEDSDDEDNNDVDDDDDFWKDDDVEGNEATADSSTINSTAATRKRNGEEQTRIVEPSKMPKFSPDSSTSDPSSPPPDPEQQSGRQRASHQDISTSS